MTAPSRQPAVHATAVELASGKQRAGVLLQGAPGSGKSSLALQLISTPGPNLATGEPVTARLVSDDQVVLGNDGGTVTLTAPSQLFGLIEVRGLGIVRLMIPSSPVPLDLVIHHREQHLIERMPEPQHIEIAGGRFALYHLDFSRTDAAARVRLICALHWGQLGLLD